MSDQGFYQNGINSNSSGIGATLTADGVVSGGGTTAVDSTAAAFTATLPPASIGAGVVVTLVATNAAIPNVVTVGPDPTIPDTIDGIKTMTTAVNPTQSYISDGVSVWVAFPYAV